MAYGPSSVELLERVVNERLICRTVWEKPTSLREAPVPDVNVLHVLQGNPPQESRLYVSTDISYVVGEICRDGTSIPRFQFGNIEGVPYIEVHAFVPVKEGISETITYRIPGIESTPP